MSASCPAWRNSRNWSPNRSRAICCRPRGRAEPPSPQPKGLRRPGRKARLSRKPRPRTQAKPRSTKQRRTSTSGPTPAKPAIRIAFQDHARKAIAMPAERLQKIIAAAGIASRRKAEELISGGHVQVNGQTVTALGSKADPEKDHIRVNGKLLHGAQRHVYFLVNKPVGYVTTVSDPEKRPTVMGLIRGVGSRVYPVGRLDYASEGLVLMTNDGALAHKLMKAASHVAKTYVVKVSGRPSEEALAKLRGGLSIATDEGRRVRTAPAKIRLVKDAPNPWYEITLIEGRNRQIRRMFEEVGHHVEKIKRVKYGPLALDVPPGEFRPLTQLELDRLRTAAGQKASEGPRRTAAS